MLDDGLMRASDHDRELATVVLRDSYTEGRLDINEFLKRVDTAQEAKTWGELAALTAELPVDRTDSLRAPSACLFFELAEVRHEPKHPFAPMWWVAAPGLQPTAGAPARAMMGV